MILFSMADLSKVNGLKSVLFCLKAFIFLPSKNHFSSSPNLKKLILNHLKSLKLNIFILYIRA